MVVDWRDLVRSRVIRCDAERLHHAGGRHAPRLGPPVRDPAAFVAAVGIGDSARAASGPPISTRALAKRHYVGYSPWRLRRHRSGFRLLERRSGGAAKPVGEVPGSGSRSIWGSVVAEVREWAALVPDPLRHHPPSQPHAGIPRAISSTADRDRAPQRAAFEGAAQCSPETNRAALSVQYAQCHRWPRAREKERCGREHDRWTERLSTPGAGGFQSATGATGRRIGVRHEVFGHSENAVFGAASGKRECSERIL